MIIGTYDKEGNAMNDAWGGIVGTDEISLEKFFPVVFGTVHAEYYKLGESRKCI